MRNYNKSERKIFTLLEYIPAFLLPCCILVLIMKICGVVPFGDKPVFIWDALYQYKDYFGYLWDVLHGNADIQYAASKSLGGGFMGILGYYCSSPLNYLLMFFNKNSIPAFMSLMVLLRISLSGLTCNIYLNKRFHTPLIFGLILSTSYALMEYNVYYCRNCMWLDGVIMLPLIALGIWNIMGDKGITLLWITVALSIIRELVCRIHGLPHVRFFLYF